MTGFGYELHRTGEHDPELVACITDYHAWAANGLVLAAAKRNRDNLRIDSGCGRQILARLRSGELKIENDSDDHVFLGRFERTKNSLQVETVTPIPRVLAMVVLLFLAHQNAVIHP